MLTSNLKKTDRNLCVVAILKDEEDFLDEWLIYHRLIGVDHFFLYDDHPNHLLLKFTKPHADYVTVIPWHENFTHFLGRNTQTVN